MKTRSHKLGETHNHTQDSWLELVGIAETQGPKLKLAVRNMMHIVKNVEPNPTLGAPNDIIDWP